MNNEMDFDIHRNEWIIFRYKTALTDRLDWYEITKVRIFWEGHKILRNLHLTFVYLLTVHTDKSKVEILQNFVAFSEYMYELYFYY